MAVQDGMATSAEQVLSDMRAGRDEMLRELGALADEELRYPATWANIPRTMNFLLRSFSLHEIDHLQHLQRLLRARGVHLSEAQLILMKAQALRGEIEAILLTLSDEQFEAAGPGDAWSARQLAEHLASTDRQYFANARKALEEGRASAAQAASAGAPSR